MYRITKDGASLGMTEAPTYIKQAPSGCLVLCPENEATGIAYEGKVYGLLGREGLPDAPTIMLEQVDGGGELHKASETGGIMFVTLAEGGQIDPATAAEHTELFAPWACPVSYAVGQIRQHGGRLYKGRAFLPVHFTLAAAACSCYTLPSDSFPMTTIFPFPLCGKCLSLQKSLMQS